MKKINFRLTPLLILSIGFIVFGIFSLFTGGNLGGLALIIGLLIAAFCFLIHKILLWVFKLNVLRLIITELLIIIVVSFVYYRINEIVTLHLPSNFTQHILIVYGVEGKPKMESDNFFTPNSDVTVPESGVIFTSSEYSASIRLDTSNGRTKAISPGYGIPISADILSCGNKKYRINIIVMGKLPPGWHPAYDTLKRKMKKELACRLLH